MSALTNQPMSTAHDDDLPPCDPLVSAAASSAEHQSASGPLPTDWTKLGTGGSSAQVIRLPFDVFDLSGYNDDSSETTDLTIVGTAGQKITKMGSDLYKHCSPNLTHLILRSHMITKMEGIGGFKKLELLELYDNAIECLEELGDETNDGFPGKTLKVLDMSYNVIRAMDPVMFCPNLLELYLANNKLKTLAGLKNLKYLRKIDLGANRIRSLDEEQLSGLLNLEELWIGKNKIETIEGISKLTKLRRLDVQSNRLTSINNLETQVDTLEELYLSHNAIDNDGASHESGLALPFSKLSVLDMSRNRLTSTAPFAHLLALEELWISGNEIATFDDVAPISNLGSRVGACLEGIYLEYNPIDKEFEYRKRLAVMIPSLKQIDANLIGGRNAAAAHGYDVTAGSGGGGGRVESIQAKMKRLQDEAIQRARIETDLVAANRKEN